MTILLVLIISLFVSGSWSMVEGNTGDQMLENLAIQYVSQSEDNLRLIGYGIVITGAVIAGLFHKGNSELRRAPYFAYSGLLFLISASAQLVWFGSIQAMTGGFLWVFMIVDIVVGLVVGYAFCVMAMARSRDAYGHARLAALAFIPLANFWLLLTHSKNELSVNRAPTISLLSGGLGVLTGFLLFFTGVVLSTFIRVEIDRMAREVQSEPAIQQASIDMMLRGQGLEATLHQMAAEVSSQRVDETTTLLRVEGDGTTLRYLYKVSTDAVELPTSMRKGLIKQNCAYNALRPVIEAGATVEHVYQRRDGSEIGTVTVTRKLCGY